MHVQFSMQAIRSETSIKERSSYTTAFGVLQERDKGKCLRRDGTSLSERRGKGCYSGCTGKEKVDGKGVL